MLQCLSGMYRKRNRAVLVLLRLSGGRISEILQLRVKDVYDGEAMVDTVSFDKQIMKGGKHRRTIPLHQQAKDELEPLCSGREADAWLFESSEKKGEHMGRSAIHKLIKQAARKAELPDQRLISAHSFRKAFARDMYEQSGHDLLHTQDAMGHKNPNTTKVYLKVNRDRVDRSIREQKSL